MDETGSLPALVSASNVVNDNCVVKPKNRHYKESVSKGCGDGGDVGDDSNDDKDFQSSNHNPPIMHPEAQQNSPTNGSMGALSFKVVLGAFHE